MQQSKKNTVRSRLRAWLDSYEDVSKPLRKGKYLFIIAMCIFPIVNFILFYAVVNFQSFLYAFQDGGVWSFLNFERFWLDITGPGSVFLEALGNTLIWFALNTFVIFPLVYLLAYFFYKKILFFSYFRVILFIPSIISGIVVVTVFKAMIAPNGPIFEICNKLFGAETFPSLTSDESTANWVMVAYSLWTGFTANLLLFMGSMNRLPKEVLESAQLDGIGEMQELVYIVTPMSWSILTVIIVQSFTTVFTASGPLLLFTDGASGTMTISYWIFKQVKDSGYYEYPSTIGLIFTLLGLPIVLAVWHFLGKAHYSETEF